MIGDEDISRVRAATDIVALFGDRVPLKQKGRDFWCCCPFHDEKTPSCKIDPSTQLWHCFGCGEGGDAFTFVMKIEDLEFPDAVRFLADRANIELTEAGERGPSRGRKARLKEVCRATADFYHLQLMRSRSVEAGGARDYLGGRGFGGDIPAKWNLGFAPGRGRLVAHLRKQGFTDSEIVEANVGMARDGGHLVDRFFDRVIFPIADAQGECIAFGGRVIGAGEPKYLNSQETPIFHKSEVLFAMDKAKAAMAATGTAIIVEGYTDAIALHEAGISNAVATLGTALTKQHVRALSRHARHRIVYLFDGDEAGRRAADRALGFIDESMTPEAGAGKVDLCAVTLPDDLDPADFVARRGADALRAEIEKAQPLIGYGIDRRLLAFDLATAEGRSRALNAALSILAPIKDSLLAKDYAVQLAGRVQAREDDVLDALARLRPPQRYEGGSTRPSSSAAPSSSVSPAGLSRTELNRLRLEREFLGILASRPALALLHADALASVSWHDGAHGEMADAILDILAREPSLSAAELISRTSMRVPRAARVLTASQRARDASPDQAARFLAEELAIGDQEAAIAGLRSRLKTDSALDSSEYETMFEAVVALQNELKRMRQGHRPL